MTILKARLYCSGKVGLFERNWQVLALLLSFCCEEDKGLDPCTNDRCSVLGEYCYTNDD